MPSINRGINSAFVAIKYESTWSVVDYVRLNHSCLLWKSELEDTFQHVVTSKVDAPLLGFNHDGVRYRENALTFGSSSSPSLFNLVAEALHWVVASSLPAAWCHGPECAGSRRVIGSYGRSTGIRDQASSQGDAIDLAGTSGKHGRSAVSMEIMGSYGLTCK
ncbi:hypothetical protein NDA18_001825 [Ustilago nuda]|nr:hypothetical protein NDA18_001825 [Ustilago nuda]